MSVVGAVFVFPQSQAQSFIKSKNKLNLLIYNTTDSVHHCILVLTKSEKYDQAYREI